MIYMDNAATTMHKPQEVIDAVVNAMNSMGNAGRGASEAALSASRVIYDTRDRLANCWAEMQDGLHLLRIRQRV